MNILIAAIGTWKPCPEQALFDEYLRRLPWSVTLKEITIKGNNTREKEATALLESAASFGTHHIIALDETGKTLSSKAFAQQIGRWQDIGDHKLCFLIGGHHGLDACVREKADFLLSLGALTWPHLLVRPLLAEQLYRSWSILTGHPYHRA